MVRIRIIPSTITVAMLLLCVKLMDITHNSDAYAQAEASKAAESKPASETKAKEGQAKPAEVPAKPAEGTTKPADSAEKTNAPATSSEAKTETKTETPAASKTPEKSEGGEKPAEDNPAVSTGPGTTVDRRYTPVEVELLQNLAQRRDELDRWERNVLIKEATLAATEKRIDDKITQVESMKKEVAALLSQYNEKEDSKIRSLVKIYENMKPKDAARIFDEVEMPILLLVIDKMSEKKVAPILAFMDSRKAKSITVQLAEQRRINNKVVNANAPAP